MNTDDERPKVDYEITRADGEKPKIYYWLRWMPQWADERLATYIQERRRVRVKQHWQAAALGGGGVVQLGHITEAEALKRLQHIKADNDQIVFVDTERGFIAYGKQPEPTK